MVGALRRLDTRSKKLGKSGFYQIARGALDGTVSCAPGSIRFLAANRMNGILPICTSGFDVDPWCMVGPLEVLCAVSTTPRS